MIDPFHLDAYGETAVTYNVAGDWIVMIYFQAHFPQTLGEQAGAFLAAVFCDDDAPYE